MTRTFGPAYDEKIDGKRIRTQMERVKWLMLRNPTTWLTLRDIAMHLDIPESSASAQLRHLLENKFGGYIVMKRRRGDSGTWEYQISEPVSEPE